MKLELWLMHKDSISQPLEILSSLLWLVSESEII